MKTTIQLLRQRLSPLYPQGEVRAISELLLEEVCGLTRTQILLHRDDLVLPPSQAQLLASYADRLALGEPVQQVLGYEWFCGRRFRVTRDVLIPRPETAELIQWIVDSLVDKWVDNPVDIPLDNPRENPVDIPLENPVDKGVEKGGRTPVDNPMDNPVEKGMEKGMDKGVENWVQKAVDNGVEKGMDNGVDNGVENPLITIVDVGTGSGCIALTLAADIHNSQVVAVDLSTAALQVAEENAKALGIKNVCFCQADALSTGILQVIPELSTVDILVSNPPYICHRERSEMSVNVLDYEPQMALFVPDEDPLLFYRAIARAGLQMLRPGGWLYFEINEAYGPATCDLLRSLGYQQVELRRDMDGRDRMVRGRRR